jgi:hypothetical protein
MASGDYRSCDVCGGKTFYDAILTYEDGDDEYAKDRPPYRQAGRLQYPGSPDLNQKHGLRLGYVGDWAVICTNCSPRFKTVIVPIDAQPGDTA